MQTTITTSDTLSPAMRALYARANDKRGIHEAIGLGLVSLAARAFGDPTFRVSAWAPLKSGQPSTLRKSGTLWQSIRVTETGETGVTVGSDRKYAAIHQMGGRTPARVIRPRNGKALWWPGAAHPVKSVNHPGSKMPPRPFLPFYPDGRPTEKAREMVEDVVRAKLGMRPGIV
jgi:phage gpG-like protein